MPLADYITDPVRRNVLLLALCQALFMSIQAMSIATTPLAGHMLLGADKSLATLPLFLTHAGIMIATIPASLLMHQLGRRAGFTIGALINIGSGAVSALALYQADFMLLCGGALLQGFAAGFAWYYRFAAADSAEPGFRAKAISLVMAGGVIAGFLGPQIAKSANIWFAPVTFAGVYIMVSVLSIGVLIIVQGLRIPMLSPEERSSSGRPMSTIARQPAFIVSLTTSMFGYGVMTLVMSATPLAMLACGFGYAESATVIQAHFIAMFLPSFFTGGLISRFGIIPIITVGALIQAVCALVHLSGIEFTNFIVGLALLGLGWNLTYVGGSSLLTTVYEPEERAKVQAAHDFSVYAVTALSAAAAGILHQQAGWQFVNIAALPLMGFVLLGAAWLAVKQRNVVADAIETVSFEWRQRSHVRRFFEPIVTSLGVLAIVLVSLVVSPWALLLVPVPFLYALQSHRPYPVAIVPEAKSGGDALPGNVKTLASRGASSPGDQKHVA